MWPPPVERVAAVLRTAGVDGRLEELPEDELDPPGPGVRAEAYECDGRRIVALVPADRDVDWGKLAEAARCPAVRPADPPTFPYTNSLVLLDRIVLGEPAVWLEAGSPRHVVALAPAQLMQVTHAHTADLLQSPETGEGRVQAPG